MRRLAQFQICLLLLCSLGLWHPAAAQYFERRVLGLYSSA